jgi:hypothetical protein
VLRTPPVPTPSNENASSRGLQSFPAPALLSIATPRKKLIRRAARSARGGSALRYFD